MPLSEEMRNQCVAQEIVAYIDELRQDEASSVEIINTNQDFNGHKNNAVICTGPWTEYAEQRFEGDTLLDSLRLAVDARREHNLKHRA